MSHWAYAVAMFCVLCVALIASFALRSVIDDRNVMFARILTPAPVVSSCMLPSRRIEDDKIAHPQPVQRQPIRQLLDEIADQFDDQPGRCDARICRRQTTDGLVRRQTRPCRAPEVCSASRPIQPSNSLMASPIVGVTQKDGDVRIACDCRYLNTCTVGTFDTKSASSQPVTRQIPLAEEHRWLTVFVMHDDLYEWLRLPFGFKNTDATVGRAVQSMLWRRGH